MHVSDEDEAWALPSADRDFIEWHQGCAWCAVWVLMLAHASVDTAIAAARQRLGPALLPRYARQPHVSVAYRGLCQRSPHPAQEFDAAALRTDLQRLQALPLVPFTLQLSGTQCFSTVPYLQVSAGNEALMALHTALNPADRDAAANAEANWRYVPHVTVGQFAQRMRLSEAQTLMQLSEWQSAPLPITQLALVRYASHDIAGALTVEGTLDLRSRRYTPSEHALWPNAR